MYVSRDYVKTVGVMDDDFFVYMEDTDWCLRRGSFTLGYAHDSVVRHIGGATSGSSSRKAERSRFNVHLEERNRILIVRKQFGVRWRFYAFIALIETLEHLILARSFRHFQWALRGWWAGVSGETGLPRFMRNKSDDENRAVLRRVVRRQASAR